MHHINSLINVFESVLPLSDTDKALMVQHTCLETLKKGALYCEQGRVCKKMGLVVDGIFKVVRTNAAGEEYILYFTNEGHFVIDLDSFYTHTPAEEKIEALTECVVITMTKNSYEFLEKEIPGFPRIVSTLKEKALLEKYKLKSEMLVDDAATKYNKLLQRQPTVVQRVPQSQIALFLGITPYTLSRIRTRK
ncbi:Crp/Fnr family transcriptional regulator [Cytophaga hutchinsonii]|jgi:CRP-like cAMP-binding protein|uniref:Cyclic nucleotide binding regulatory protein n=1 Tax=Cytophaga hutchinsonii (strain ATCC 33406 / DSM 1761 / CIP 103989 / NBRC 15051 / NCIMB 9469 / D465) TaxID=269798 RepID=A0A6N4SQ36_CYTH3|nr:Crp/Fnr family transcriptional regulator [Cytophaga hutchinsonii]ABG58367.1 cyclic nucleotide binding regulatory protein [Cytophaga hutchinsonii ATCC 33406]SFX51606.1 cAMP-binding domain of CRP or a regulatory subunit of cAMP-dependent protein kinases [Cytophaga hutchinsonii ATCC 33406]